MPSEMPSSARASGFRRWWVVVAGCVIRLLASPRLLEMRISLQRVEEAERPGLAAFDLEGHERAGARHLPPRERGLRVVGRPQNSTRAMPFCAGHVVGDLRRRLALRAHAQRQRLQALQHHPGVERAERRAGMPQEGVQVVLEEGFCEHEHHAAEAAALAVDVLGGGVDHDVGAELQRLLQQGRGEHVVDDDEGAGCVRDLGSRPRCRPGRASGLAGVSKKNALVLGRTARCQAA